MEKTHFNYLPVSLFGSIMGLSGFSVSLFGAAHIYGLWLFIPKILSIFTIFAFFVLLITYGIKVFKSTQSFVDEFKNPLTKSFFGTVGIAFLLIPLLFNETFKPLGYIFWIIGVIFMLIFAWYMVNFWIKTPHEQTHITPAWIVPVVGTLDIPLASHLFDINAYYLNIFSISVGLFFTIPIVTLILSRVIFFSKLPEKLIPTLMILVAPFSVGFLAYINTYDKVDGFAMALYFLGLFIFLTLLPKLFSIAKNCPFRVTWWAISFPLAALLNSTLKMYEASKSDFFYDIGLVMLVVFSIIFIWLIYTTLKGIFNGGLKNLT